MKKITKVVVYNKKNRKYVSESGAFDSLQNAYIYTIGREKDFEYDFDTIKELEDSFNYDWVKNKELDLYKVKEVKISLVK